MAFQAATGSGCSILRITVSAEGGGLPGTLPSSTQFALLRGVSPIGGGWIEAERAQSNEFGAFGYCDDIGNLL